MAYERTGIDDIQAGYKMYPNAPYYALFNTGTRGTDSKPGDLIYTYDQGDRDQEGWDLLQTTLRAGEQTAPEAGYIIRFYRDLGKNGSIDSNTPYCGSFKLRMRRYDAGLSRSSSQAGGDMSLMNQLIDARFENLQQKYEHMMDDMKRRHEEELEELEEELEDKAAGSKHMGIIGTLGEAGDRWPWMQDILKQAITVFNDVIKDTVTVAKHKMRPDAHREEPAIGKIPADAAPDVRMRAALDKLISYNTDRFGWPEGTSTEQKKAAAPDVLEAARVKGFTIFSDTLVMLCGLCDDDDVYDLAVKKLKQL